MMILVAQEIGQHVVPAPAVKPELAPAVVVARLAAHVDHAVDGGAAADHPAARIGDVAAVEAGLRRGAKHPVGALDCRWRRDSRRECAARSNCRARPPRAAARFAGIGAQAVGHQAAGGAGADDDVIVGPRSCLDRPARDVAAVLCAQAAASRAADVHRQRAARMKRAARRRIDRRRRLADHRRAQLERRDRRPASPPSARGYRGAAAPRTAPPCRRSRPRRRDRSPSPRRRYGARPRDRARRTHKRAACASCNLRQQVQHLRANGDVERRHRLVEHENFRASASARGRWRCAGAGRRRTCAGSGDRTPAEAHLGHHSSAASAALRGREIGVDEQRLLQRLADLLARIERADRGFGTRSACRGAARAPRRREALRDILALDEQRARASGFR